MSREQLKADFEAAQALQQAGRLAEAERAWLNLDQAASGHVGVMTNLAMVQWQLGNHAAAEANCQRALAVQPGLVQAQAIYAAAAEVRGDVAEATARYERALELKPDLATALQALANLHRRQGRLETARELAQRLAAAAPHVAQAHETLGGILLAMDELDGAENALRRAVELDPNLASARGNLGAVLTERRQWEPALTHLDIALGLDASMAETHNNRGNALVSLGRSNEALAAFESALDLKPDFADARFNHALVTLKQGRWTEAWPGFEKRWETRQMAPFRRSFNAPLWDGTPALDQSVLIHAEQGMGDTMMVARYLPLVAERVGRLSVECQAALKPLLDSMPGDFHVLEAGGGLPAFDLHLPAMSLPAVFGTSPETVPWSGPYLNPAAESGDLSGDGLKIGLVWAGNPLNPTDAERSTSLTQLAPLLEVPGCSFFSLQHGVRGDEISNGGLAHRIVDMRPQMNDFAATAALLADLDLVITICTSVAHLAGGMGKTVWVLLAHDADWRWLQSRNDSPWYPTARLFRQPTPGDWESLVADVSTALGAEKSR
ncbi:MAG: tetratricopeptide repeat protein [Rhodospirillaceae bacterium]|nr:tetratricopeptide repeat protein [Rhodospirillaceae bacterium]